MELKPELIGHWDAFNANMESVTLLRVGPIYVTRHENILYGGQVGYKYWPTREEAEEALKTLHENWAKERKSV